MVAVGRSIDERIFLRLRIWQKQDLDKEEICSEKDSLESKIMPRLRAEVTGWIVTLLGIDRIMLLTLASWELLPSKRNSVMYVICNYLGDYQVYFIFAKILYSILN